MEALLSQVFQFLMDCGCSLGNAVRTSFIVKRVNRETFSQHLIIATLVESQERYVGEDLSLRGFQFTQEIECVF